MKTLWVCVLVFMTHASQDATLDQALQASRNEALVNYPRNIVTQGILKPVLHFTPLSISGLDELTQTFSFTAMFAFLWQDPNLRLNINLSEYNQTHEHPMVSYSSEEILTPIFVIMNSAFGNVFQQMDKDLPIFSDVDGNLSMYNILGLRTLCDVDVTHFPFDEQICKVNLQSYVGVFNTSTIHMRLLGKSEKDHSEWLLMNVTSSSDKTFGNIITFHLKRQSSFYILGIVFPMVLLSILNSCVFLLPADSGEKISFLVSIFVTYAVFLNFVTDLIPKSDRLPRLVVYLVLVQCHSTLCILATLFILNRHHKKDNDDAKEKARRNRNQDENQYANEDMHQKHCQSNTVKSISVHSRITTALTFKTVERSLFFAFLVLAASTLLVLFV